MLRDVIDLLRINGDVFAKRSLTCRFNANDFLYKKMREWLDTQSETGALVGDATVNGEAEVSGLVQEGRSPL